tara:strand:- start:403 stop:762 length:360 start_codon:yes stop_codon:yes gene_type:complete
MLPILINSPNSKKYNFAKKLLTEFGLADRLNFKPINLSGGEQQRVAIARALVNNPKLIIADEMTGNLDEKTSNEIFNFLLRYLKQRKISLIYATHDVQMSKLADIKYGFTNKNISKIND